ncbi:hypothetical protein LCGC14_2382440 [marine sediment metagenome]|uniref:Uncharacterized protein n=1 Tax=marine sediment metagenome TaxID=412755 RepID=A0A0F9EVB6_9ZZZZ|nr:hypothetical protein [bacterium]
MKAQVILKKWRGRIERAQKRGKFTDNDRRDAYDWSKCAVGERDCMCEKILQSEPSNFIRSDIVRNGINDKVARLGSRFHTEILNNNFRGALAIIKRIELAPKKRFYK